MLYLLEFTAFFFFILLFGYVLPAGVNYWLYFVRDPQQPKIQDRQPTRKQIIREVKLSLWSVAIFAAMSTVTYELYKAGHTSIYTTWPTIPGELIASIFLCMVLHDTWFYWLHRFMHWRPVFKYLHASHHRSISPTPWAIFAFDPGEAFLQFLGFVLLIVFVPLHPIALVVFLVLDAQMNVGGHTGYELVPRFVSRHPLFQGFNTVAHHDGHHTNMSKNFGSFFNVWDRWMGTFEDNQAPEAESAAAKQSEKQPCRALIVRGHA